MTDKLNFREISALWKTEKKNYVKRSSMYAYLLILENHLLPEFADTCDVTEEEVQRFVISRLETGLTQKSVKDIVVVLKMIVRYGAKHASFSTPDWKIRYPSMEPTRTLAVLSVKNQRKLMNLITSNFTFRNLGILICLHTGMRIGEICALRWEDVDVQQGIISVNKTIERLYVVDEGNPHTEVIMSSPKTRNSRRDIPITTSLLKILKPLKKIVNNRYFVLTNDERPTEPRTYRNYYKKLLRRADIPEMKFHCLRHTFATRCIESHCDYKTVSVLLGHANIATTLNLYVHPNLEQKKRCLDRMAKSLSKL